MLACARVAASSHCATNFPPHTATLADPIHARLIWALGAANAQLAALEALGDEATLEQLEAAPDTDGAGARKDEARSQLEALRELEELVKGCKGTVSEAVARRAQELGVGDAPPPKQPRGPKKKKGPRASEVAPRLPYWRYTSIDGVEIRVGRRAEDNDDLSCGAQHRDGADWWMHAAGCPGSHVVIRTHDDAPPKGTITDAAALAAKYSKARQRGRTPVTLCRCRQISKPRGAKAGLVQIRGDARTVRTDVFAEASRLKRLEETKH